MRYVIFYEGDSERNMLDQALNKSPQFIYRTEDIEVLLTTPHNQLCAFFYPCGGHQNVFPYIERNQQLYSDEETILLVIRDLEQVPCYVQLKDEMQQICSALPERTRVKPLFSKPEFEQVYFSDLALLEELVAQTYQTRTGYEVRSLTDLHERIQQLDLQHPSRSLRRLFRDYGLAYNKPELAEMFFARYFARPDFRESAHPYIRRVLDALGELLALPS